MLCAAAIAAGLEPRQARAEIVPVQWQYLALGSVDVFGENPSGQLAFNSSIYGFGLSIGIGGEALLEHEHHLGGAEFEEWEGGGFLDLAFQFRPFMLVTAVADGYRHWGVYEFFDPHVDVGGTLGVITEDDDFDFRGTFYVGGSLDFGIPTNSLWMNSQVLITVGYRYSPFQTPDGPAHYIVFGIGSRAGF